MGTSVASFTAGGPGGGLPGEGVAANTERLETVGRYHAGVLVLYDRAVGGYVARDFR